MKKVLFIAIIVTACVTFAACNSCNIEEPPITTGTDSPTDKDATPATTTTTTTKAPPIGNATTQAPINDDGTGLFYMDMSVVDFKLKAKELGWIVYDEPLPDGSYYVKLFDGEPGIYFVFENNLLIEMYTNYENITTEKSIKVGDPESKIKQLYGEPSRYELWEEGSESYYYYDNGDITLSFQVNHGTKIITQWQIGLTEHVKWWA